MVNRLRKASHCLAAFAALLLVPASLAGAQSLGYHGGSVIHHPKLHVIYWHEDWDSIHTDPQFKRANIDSWLSTWAASNYFDMANQYDVHSGSFGESNQSSLLTAEFGRNPLPDTNSLNIHLWWTAEVETPFTGVPYPCENDLYVILLPKGCTIDNIVNQTCGSFGAYHLFGPILTPPFNCGLFDSGGVTLAPYCVIPVDCATKDTGPNGFYTDFDELTMLMTHEIIEACTDPIDSFITSVPVIGDIFQFLLSFIGADPAWYDANASDLFRRSEAADICEFAPFSPEVWHNDSLVAAYWSNDGSAPAAGPGFVKSFTLAQTGVPSSVAVPVTFDSRSPNVGPSSFSIQVVTNSTHNYAFPSPVVGAPGVQYVTSEPPASVLVTGDFSKTAAYTAQDFLTVSTNPAAAATGNGTLTPSGFYNSGAFTIHSDQDVDAGAGSRYDFRTWSGDISGSTHDFTFNLSSPTNAVANYQLQRFITFDQSGIPAGPAWHVTVNGSAHGGPFSDWFDDASSVSFSYETPVADTTPGTRYVLTGTSSASPLTVTAPATVIGSYKTQHLLTVNTSGLGANTTRLFNGGTQIGSASDSSPFSDWFDHGTSLVLTADDVVIGAGGTSYFFQSFTPTPPTTLNAPFTTTALYETIDQLIDDAINGGGIYGPGANGIANSLKQKWAAVTAKLASGQYATALNLIKAFINEIQAQTGKHITPATSKTLQLDALLVFHNALCLAQSANQLTAAQAAGEQAYYGGSVTTLGGVPKPPCP